MRKLKTAVAIAAVGASIAIVETGCRPDIGGGPEPSKRVVVLGFDGVDPDFVTKWMDELPNVAKLAESGTFKRLETTIPPASCTAWSSFATGLNPGGHGIFDFIYRHPENYLPDRTGAISKKAEYLWGLFETKPETFDSTMSGEPFWKRIDGAGLRSVVLRVPCIYPLVTTEQGRIQAGLGAPDIRGSEGTFHFWTSALTEREAADPSLGGKVIALPKGDVIETYIEGPANPLADSLERLRIPLRLRVVKPNALEIELDGTTAVVEVGKWSDWFRMEFDVTAFSSIAGMSRFRVIALEPHVELFMSPINHDPADPAIAVTEPQHYAPWLRDQVGDYKTVGWNHETWGLNEERIDDDAFMEDVFDTMEMTEKVTFEELDRNDAELFISVFVETDRAAHMMYRLMDEQHPRYDASLAAKHADAVLETYRRMDSIIGRVLEKLGSDDVLLILSDHGFHSWRRGFNVNTWLVQEGYMTLKNGAAFTDRKFLQDVDWSKTRAYALGVGGIYLNVRGREAKGIVDPGDEYRKLAHEIAAKLEKLVDPETGERVAPEVYFAPETWKGPRVPDAQDLHLGLAPGYRVSSATPLGGAPQGLFEDNQKKWSGDHATSQASVTEGVLMSNHRIQDEETSILDLAPTILSLLDVDVPGDYDGKVLELSAGE